MEMSSPEAIGVLSGIAVFLLLVAWYMKSDYLRDNFLKIKEEEITWDDNKKKGDREARMDEALKAIGSEKTYKDINRIGLFITIAGIAAVIFSGLPVFVALLFLIVYVKFPDLMLVHLKKKRMDVIQEQLTDAINRIRQVLNVGGQMSQGFEEAANECKKPVADEFRKISLDLSTGASMNEALDNFYKRCPLPDVKVLCVGCIISDKVSKEVAVQTLEMTEGILYRRNKQTMEIKTLLQSGNILVKVLGAAPIIGLVGMEFMMPLALNKFLDSFYGQIGLTIAIILNVAGYFVAKRIMDPNRIINY